ncbi:MAG: hypothetical protein Q9191_003522 [Dirinaria sp. TL-2023a]
MGVIGMDPVSIIGLTAAIQQILTAVYQFGHGVVESKKEINQLCSELLALKAALEHVQINLSLGHDPKSETQNVASPLLSSTNLSTPECTAMASSAEAILKELLTRLKSKSSTFKKSLQRLTWPLVKEDVMRYVERLHRLTSWFVLATTSDNILEGTGKWFLDGTLQHWLDEESPPILWLRAKREPSLKKFSKVIQVCAHVFATSWCGKDNIDVAAETLSLLNHQADALIRSTAIRHARVVLENRKRQQPVAFFYCSFSTQETQDIRTIIASLVFQLCEARPALWDDVIEQYLNSKRQLQYAASKMSVEDCMHVLSQGSAKASGTYLFLDAINESRQWRGVLDMIKKLLQTMPSVRIMISSTEELDDPFKAGEAGLVLMDWRKELTRKRTPKEIRKALAHVPKNLAETYQGILARIPSEDVDTAKQMLFWISSALVPMTLQELCEAVIIADGPMVVNDDARLLNPKSTLELCSSLVSYDNSTTRISLAHSSVLAYLRSQNILDSEVRCFYLSPEAEFQAVPRRCINYLLMPVFRSGCCSTETELSQRLESWPLLTYIADTLFDHLEYVDLHDPGFRDLILRFFATHKLPRGGNFGAWVQAFIPDTTFNIKSSTPLYYAARFGLLRLVRLILQTQGTTDLEKPGGVYGSTPLHVASWAERPEVVKELLDAGANPKETNFSGQNGLYWAVIHGNKVIEQMLREAGAVVEEGDDSEL